MKNLLYLFILILFNPTIEAQTKLPQPIETQTKLPPERIVIVADISNDRAKTVDYALADLRIESKITRAFRLDSPNLKLVNPTITDEGGKGWFIEYEFESGGSIGLWKEELQLRNGQLVITESRSAKVGIATNCKKIQFTNDKDYCKCAEKKNTALDSEVTFRLFSSIN